ncbi:GNAT family N-acetyltransferase [Kribbella antibiotica]|uniref:GNAT family N-acetyltransferase n=2 Tax=Kribbella antibiotica TaxID=190195 RepID=A0A4R4Z8Z4_9ACTN|nr:GNAT family N-acetyltransferase [Kribbella antibiotica]
MPLRSVDVEQLFLTTAPGRPAAETPHLAPIRLGSPAAEQLQEQGWIDAHPGRSDVLVMHTTLDHVNALPPYEVQLAERPDDSWYGVAFEGPVPAPARIVLEGAPKAVFATISVDGWPAAVGRGSMTGHWLGIDAVRVLPDHRGNGLATAVVQALARWAGSQGGRRTYVEVLESNLPAVTAYERLGYVEAYRYRYLVSPSQ